VKAFNISTLAVAGLPLIFACGGDDLTLPSGGQPAHIEILDGSGQQGPVGTELGKELLVKVTDSQGRPVPGLTVQFVLQEDLGGGSVTPATPTTNEAGEIAARIKLGTQVGTLSGEAQLPADQGETPVAAQFTAVAFATGANTIVMASGEGQSAPVGTALGLPLVVQVTDGFGNPVSGVTVNWAAVGGGEVSSASTLTDINGEASVTRTLGPTAGEQQTQASAEGLNGSPVTFTHTATAGNASTVTIISGNNQEAPAGSQLPQPLVVRVLDEQGNPIVGRPVSWVVGDGGGTPNPPTSNTNGEGLASTSWTLGSTPGDNTLNAVVSGVGTAMFNASGTGTGSPSNLAVVTQPPSSVTVGATLSPAPVVQIRDNAGHDLAVPGVEVTASVSSGRGQLDGTRTVATDASGRATFGDLRISGASGSHRLIFAADGYRSVTSNKIEVEKASTTTTISQSSQSSNSGEQVTVSFTVGSAAGTPAGNVEVIASNGPDDEKCTATVAQGSCQITLTSAGNWSLTATYQGNDVFASSSSATITHQVNGPPPPLNFPPVATDDIYSASRATSFTAPGAAGPNLLTNDADLDFTDILSASAEAKGTANGGSVTIRTDGSFDYTPPVGFAGPNDSFDYTVTDGRGGSDVGTATVTFTD
jgi:hypothetical protein